MVIGNYYIFIKRKNKAYYVYRLDKYNPTTVKISSIIRKLDFDLETMEYEGIEDFNFVEKQSKPVSKKQLIRFVFEQPDIIAGSVFNKRYAEVFK